MSVCEEFEREGVVHVPTAPDPAAVAKLYEEIRNSRVFDQSMFLDEDTFRANPQYKGVNPGPGGFNLLERLDDGFVLEDPAVKNALTSVLGNYEIMLKKVICGVPQSLMPDWVHEEVKDRPVPNLGFAIKPEYRDITYFYGIDFHQDIIDFPGGQPDFVTLYYYIHPVTRNDAPLHVIPQSHALGFSTFPHTIERAGDGLVYRNGDAGALTSRQMDLIGNEGTCYFWHPYTLHGTGNVKGDQVRLSLRYLIRSLDRTLSNDGGGTTTRTDLSEEGAAKARGNFIKAV